MKFKENQVNMPSEILYNDHFVGMATMVSSTNIIADSEGKKIVKAGSIIPKNDATAKGVLLSDVDVTNGDAPGTIVIHGFVDNAKLIKNGITVTAEAMGAIPQVMFVGCETKPVYNTTTSGQKDN